MALLTYKHANGYVAGCDEAGRGCLAGPVVAAAVILPPHFSHPMLRDSKQLNHSQRQVLKDIIARHALAYGIAAIDVQTIDSINILNAAILAMHRALDTLTVRPAMILVDGNRFKPYANIEHQCIIKGDNKYLCIAAASIIAKTHRDELMLQLHNRYPQYGWDKNKAYATRAHVEAIKLHGYCKEHRKSFHLKSMQLQIFD